MSDRLMRRLPSRPTRRRPDAGHGPRLRPAVEALEGRALLSYGGSPDLTFGTGGFAALTLPTRLDTFSATAMTAQPDGKVVVVGDLYVPGGGPNGGLARDLAVIRLNVDGTLDTTFGGGGFFTNPGLSDDANGANDILFQAAAIQADGKVVVAGSDQGIATVVRLDADGAIDATFGSGGIVFLASRNAVGSTLNVAEDLAILPDGMIAVGGLNDPVSSVAFPGVEGLNVDGSIDTSFGSGGLSDAPTPVGSSGYDSSTYHFGAEGGLVAQPDGKLVLLGNATIAGTADDEVVASRLTATGSLDPTFGVAGQAIVTAQSLDPRALSLGSSKLAIQADGKLVIAGVTLFPSIGVGGQTTVVRLNADGAADPTFGINGGDILVGGNLVGNGIGPNGLAIGADGKVVVQEMGGPAFTRLDANGVPDISFGAGGTDLVPEPTGVGLYNAIGVAILPDGKIVAAMNATRPGLVRLIGTGAPGDYNNDGVSDPAVLDTTTATFTDLPSGGGPATSSPFGDAGPGLTLPAPGAYSGGGITEVAAYLPGPGGFEIQPYQGGAPVTILFGMPGLGNSLPAPGDYDGSGSTELAVYLPSVGAFAYRPSDGEPDEITPFGAAGAGKSIPAEADYFGTGRTDFAVYLVDQGAYQIYNPVANTTYTIPFGTPGAGRSIPVPGDYDGSGHAELAVYVPASGDLIYRPADGGADVVVPIGLPGVAQSIPAIGDYDGSGHDEAAVYEPAAAMFTYIPSSGGPAVSVPLGTANQAVPFSMGTNSVAESGLGGSGSPGAIGVPAVVPLTQDVLDAPAGSPAKKKAAIG